jgi:glycosyltransferase involved in cell wall biosynthesis
MPQYDIAFSLTGDVRRNSRAMRQLRAMTHEGYRVVALGMAATAPQEEVDGVQLCYIARPCGSGPLWFFNVHRQFSRLLATIDARLYHASDLFVLPASAVAARPRGRSYTYDSRELYPHVGATAGKPWASAFWAAVERKYIRSAHHVYTVCDSIADRLSESYQISRPSVVRNVPEHDRPQASSYLSDHFGIPEEATIALHQGYLKPARGCEILLEAAAPLPDVHVVFLGDGPIRRQLQDRATALGLDTRTHFHPFVPPEELLPVTSSADVGVCLIEPATESLRLSLPNKLFEYIWAGLPVLASDLPEISRVVRSFDVGLTVDPASSVAVTEALRTLSMSPDLRRQLSSRTSDVMETYCWERASDVFMSPIRDILSR